MIEFKKLRKVYKSRNSGTCVALKDIDLKLPDSGLVFIIGKSGSGKSTLLNLLGGLDTITSGDIIADGNSLSSFNKKDFENYRSSYIGFVFQHYYLLDELTVKQNIELAMGIVGSDDQRKVADLLAKVGLTGCEDRYPKELSGGQQQRVAIARALAKNPKLILGDELTGNLDHKTSVDILNVLKEISKDKLVIVVSHNLDEADMFADRIIELHDGQIFRDRSRITRNQNKFTIKGKVAYLPYFRDLTPDEVNALNTGLRTGQILDIVQRDDGFVMSTDPKDSKRKLPLPRRRFISRRRREYTGIFTRKGFMSKALTVLITTLMILCVSVFSSMHKIEHSEVPYDSNANYISMVKGGLENPGTGIFSAYYYRVLDSEVEAAESISGEKTYQLVNVTVLTSPNGSSSTASGTQSDLRRNFSHFYLHETYGTLVCDEDFIIGEYGVDGKIVYEEGCVYDPEKTLRGVTIITDYVADALIKFYPDRYTDYTSIIDKEIALAIIDTGYEARYASIMEKYDALTGGEVKDIATYESLYHELCNTPLFEQYLREVTYSLGITYTFDEDFVSDIINNPSRTTATVRHVSFAKEGKTYPTDIRTSVSMNYSKSVSSSSEDLTVEGTSVKMGYNTYNSIFGTSYTLENYKSAFEPHTVVMKVYDRKLDGGVVLYEKTLSITSLVQSNGIAVSKDMLNEVKHLHIQPFGIYVKNNDKIDDVISTLSETEIAPRSIAFDAIAGINKTFEVFIPLLKLIAGGLYIFIIVYLINHAIQTIKKNYFQIGVLRSFGASNGDVGVIFITGVVLTGIAIAVLSIVFEPLIVEAYNAILVESFAMVLNTNAFDIKVINMPIWLPIINAVLVIVITMASALISLLVLRNLKPIEIIRAKDNGGEVS